MLVELEAIHRLCIYLRRYPFKATSQKSIFFRKILHNAKLPNLFTQVRQLKKVSSPEAKLKLSTQYCQDSPEKCQGNPLYYPFEYK